MDSQVGVRTVSGSLWRALSALAVPALLMQVVQTIGFLGEVYFVSRLGKVATAAVGLVGELSWLLSTLTTLVTVSTTTLMAQRWGAGDVSGARTVMRAAIAQSVLFGALAFWVWFVRHFVWQSLGADVTVRRTAEVYLLVALLTFPLMNLASGYGAIARGLGDMRTPLFISAAATGMQLGLNAFLTPLWGIAGAAMALAASRLVAVALFVWHFLRHPLTSDTPEVTIRQSDYHRDLLRLGIPAGAQTLLWALASFAFFAMLNRMEEGTAAVAAFTIGLRIESAAFMIALAFAMATQTLVGQNVGAGQWHRAWKGTWQATLWCLVVMIPVCVVLFFGAERLSAHFATDPTTHRYAAAYLRVAALAEPFWALSMTTGAALQGAGDTRTPAFIAILTQWLFVLPLTYAFCLVKGNSPLMAWWLVGASGFLTGVITAVAFVAFGERHGRRLFA